LNAPVDSTRAVEKNQTLPEQNHRNEVLLSSAATSQTAATILLFLALETPDLPIKQPDLDITAVYKLASGIERVGICFGLDRFVRSYTIGSIDEVSPIRRHGVLPSPRQRVGEWNWRKGAMQEPNGTGAPAAGNRAETIDR
jgi:hypothetical protein